MSDIWFQTGHTIVPKAGMLEEFCFQEGGNSFFNLSFNNIIHIYIYIYIFLQEFLVVTIYLAVMGEDILIISLSKSGL